MSFDSRRRPDYREYRPRDRFSPDRGGPPMKRMRNDWGQDRSYHGKRGFHIPNVQLKFHQLIFICVCV